MYTCDCVSGGILFEYDSVRCGCSNTRGFLFKGDYKGELPDYNAVRKMREQISDGFKTGVLPQCCKNCYMLKRVDDSSYTQKISDKITRLYFTHWVHCNCGCIYCCNSHRTKGSFSDEVKSSEFYSLLPVIKDLTERNMIDKNTDIYPLGGECTVLDEFENIIKVLMPVAGNFIFVSSGIAYSDVIAQLLSEDRADIAVSLDSGTAELYKKIKRRDSFDKVLSVMGKYVRAAEKNPKRVCAKYILIRGLNDTKADIHNFVKTVSDIGVKTIQIDVNTCDRSDEIPDYYDELFDYFMSFNDRISCVAVNRTSNSLKNKKIL